MKYKSVLSFSSSCPYFYGRNILGEVELTGDTCHLNFKDFNLYGTLTKDKNRPWYEFSDICGEPVAGSEYLANISKEGSFAMYALPDTETDLAMCNNPIHKRVQIRGQFLETREYPRETTHHKPDPIEYYFTCEFSKED